MIVPVTTASVVPVPAGQAGVPPARPRGSCTGMRRSRRSARGRRSGCATVSASPARVVQLEGDRLRVVVDVRLERPGAAGRDRRRRRLLIAGQLVGLDVVLSAAGDGERRDAERHHDRRSKERGHDRFPPHTVLLLSTRLRVPQGTTRRPGDRIQPGTATPSRCGSSICSIRGALARPERRSTVRLSFTRTSVGTSSTPNGRRDRAARRCRRAALAGGRAPCARCVRAGSPCASPGPSGHA